MQPNRTVIFVIGGLILAALVLVGALVFVQSRSPNGTATSRNGVAVNDNETARAFANLLKTKAEQAPDDRLILYGGSLATGNAEVMTARLKEAIGLTLEFQSQPLITSRQAISGLTPVFQKPPKVLVLDITRYDGANDIPINETSSNLAIILAKAGEVGTRIVVLGGVGSNGDTRLAELLKPSVEKNGTWLDASGLLLNSTYRISSTQLNQAGAEKLANELAPLVGKLPAS